MFPSAFTVSTERYLLSRRFYFYTPAKPKPLARDLIDYVTSESAEQAIRAAGFIDLGVSLKNAEPCVGCTPRYAAATKRARRLSLDFRFRPGTRDLDARAARDVDRVVRFVHEHPTTKVLLFGFSEPTKDARVDQKRSRELAQAVDTELGARGLRASVVEGFGGDMPTATETTEFGRTKNRRVEIWLQDK
jgi:phosphate transport system substrate-binding protein